MYTSGCTQYTHHPSMFSRSEPPCLASNTAVGLWGLLGHLKSPDVGRADVAEMIRLLCCSLNQPSPAAPHLTSPHKTQALRRRLVSSSLCPSCCKEVKDLSKNKEACRHEKDTVIGTHWSGNCVFRQLTAWNNTFDPWQRGRKGCGVSWALLKCKYGRDVFLSKVGAHESWFWVI